MHICFVKEVRVLSEKLMLQLFFSYGVSIGINPLCSISFLFCNM